MHVLERQTCILSQASPAAAKQGPHQLSEDKKIEKEHNELISSEDDRRIKSDQISQVWTLRRLKIKASP